MTSGVSAAKQCGNGLALDLSGFAGLVCKYTIYAPDASGAIAFEGGYASCTRFGDVYTVEVRFGGDHMKVRLE